MKAAQRAYESPLREEQAALTRQRILEAMTELLADPDTEEVTIPLVSQRARVSLRTVYRHFPTREALFDAWGAWADERMPLHSYPQTLRELMEFAPRLYVSYDENEALICAMLSSKAARGVRIRTRRRRQRAFKAAMGELVAPLAPEAREQALAVVYLLVSAPAWRAMRDQWGLDGVEAGGAAAWAVRVLVEEIRRNPQGLERPSEKQRPSARE